VATSNSITFDSHEVQSDRLQHLLCFEFDDHRWAANNVFYRESTSIPKNPRTDRPVGYAFVDLSTPSEAERAISELSGKEILERKVSVQLARKPEPAGEKGAASGGEAGSGGEGEGGRRRPSGRGRGRGRGRGGRGGRAAHGVSLQSLEKRSQILICQ
jgi:RNA recognition motif-containing protein